MKSTCRGLNAYIKRAKRCGTRGQCVHLENVSPPTQGKDGGDDLEAGLFTTGRQSTGTGVCPGMLVARERCLWV